MDKTVELRKKELRKKELRKKELRKNELVAFFEPKADSADPRNVTVISNSINGRTVIDGHDPYYKFPEGGPRKSDRDHNLTSGPDPPLLIGFRVKSHLDHVHQASRTLIAMIRHMLAMCYHTTHVQPHTRPEASHARPAPSHARPEPSHARPELSYARPEPSYARPEPSYARSEPSYARSELTHTLALSVCVITLLKYYYYKGIYNRNVRWTTLKKLS